MPDAAVQLPALTILFANPAFVAVDKPSGWLSVPSRIGDDDVRPTVGRRLEAQLSARVWPVHRLDQEVSGVLLFALSADAHRAATRWFETRTIHKLYEAITEGQKPDRSPNAHADGAPPTFIWEGVMARGKKRAFLAAHGKPSVTHAWWRGLAAGGDQDARLIWELEPLTGRSHQLRFDLARHGFPIVGDRLYGSTCVYGDAAANAIALRSIRLDFSGCEGHAKFELPLVISAKRDR